MANEESLPISSNIENTVVTGSVLTPFTVGTAESDYATIHAAVAACDTGIIFIRPGTYNEPIAISFTNANTHWHIFAYDATITGFFTIDATNVKIYGGTWICSSEPLGNPSMFGIINGSTVAINGATLSSAIEISNISVETSNLTIYNSTITGTDGDGGQIIILNSSTIVINSCILYNPYAVIVNTTNNSFLTLQNVQITGLIIDNNLSEGTVVNIYASVIYGIISYGCRINLHNSTLELLNITGAPNYIYIKNSYITSLNITNIGLLLHITGSHIVTFNIDTASFADAMLINSVFENVTGMNLPVAHITGCRFINNVLGLTCVDSNMYVIFNSCVFEGEMHVVSNSNRFIFSGCHFDSNIYLSSNYRLLLCGCKMRAAVLTYSGEIVFNNCVLESPTGSAVTAENDCVLKFTLCRFKPFSGNSIWARLNGTNTTIYVSGCTFVGNLNHILFENSTSAGAAYIYNNTFDGSNPAINNSKVDGGVFTVYHAGNQTTGTGYIGAPGSLDDNTVITGF